MTPSLKKDTDIKSEKKRDRNKEAERQTEGDSIKMKGNLLITLEVET